MSASYDVPNAYVQYKGVWDMQDLYETIADFFKDNMFYYSVHYNESQETKRIINKDRYYETKIWTKIRIWPKSS